LRLIAPKKPLVSGRREPSASLRSCWAALPEFVRALVAGTFHALVDASLQQMKAYVELMAATARSVDSLAATRTCGPRWRRGSSSGCVRAS